MTSRARSSRFDGVRRQLVTDFMRKTPYRLLCTATAAPNDYIELGTSSEALGYLGHMDMLSRFFTNKRPDHQGDRGRFRTRGGAEWRFKGYAEQPFWRWVASWARAMRKPSDLGFDDGRFQLPALELREHIVEARSPREDTLFDLPAPRIARSAPNRAARSPNAARRTAELLADAGSAVAWCQ